MKIKVCGMKYADNIQALSMLPVDMMGFIFYPRSLRYAGLLNPEALSAVPPYMRKVGVFVNEPVNSMLEIMNRYDLQIVQLHGEESPDVCKKMKDEGYPVIKAFNVAAVDDFEKTIPYETCCDFFLFDTKTSLYGGSGRKFDWNILDAYKAKIPFLLSGGIGPEDTGRLKAIQHPYFYGVDLNSRFETEPGRKDIELLNDYFY